MKEKNVLITGASRGIGRETARIFAQNGYTLFLTCQNRIDLLRETAGELNDLFSVPCFPFVGDMETNLSSRIFFPKSGRAAAIWMC